MFRRCGALNCARQLTGKSMEMACAILHSSLMDGKRPMGNIIIYFYYAWIIRTSLKPLCIIHSMGSSPALPKNTAQNQDHDFILVGLPWNETLIATVSIGLRNIQHARSRFGLFITAAIARCFGLGFFHLFL